MGLPLKLVGGNDFPQTFQDEIRQIRHGTNHLGFTKNLFRFGRKLIIDNRIDQFIRVTNVFGIHRRVPLCKQIVGRRECRLRVRCRLRIGWAGRRLRVGLVGHRLAPSSFRRSSGSLWINYGLGLLFFRDLHLNDRWRR